MAKRIFIIAEAGVNHNGSPATARKLAAAAAGAGADAVKFQTFSADRLACGYAPKAQYQKKRTGGNESQSEMLRRLELGQDAQRELCAYCRRLGITFLSSPFDIESVGFLAALGMKVFKIPSGEITDLPYLRAVGRLKREVILSTGMADLGETAAALKVLTACGTRREHITVLHCTSQYPPRIRDVNLRAMLTIRDRLKVAVGYSDHTQGFEVALAAAAMGAQVIEKHFTLDRRMAGPDHAASLEPRELAQMVAAVRKIELALGSADKKPCAAEIRIMNVARKCIVAAGHISRGERFSGRNLTTKRTGLKGISPMRWDALIGRIAGKAYEPDEPIR